ncbi:MAG: hypothetical protein MUF84_07470 [Anaerolineae bacterium]|jgi:hypothetical protein|nr:hypothetical protein [Anaerolineae bacterium]
MEKTTAVVGTWHGPLGIAMNRLALALGLLVILSGGLFAGWRLFGPQPKWVPGTMPVSPEIEEKFGVRFTFLAVTADGGMVELRYRVIDEGKAANFGHYSETAPLVISEDDGKIIDVTIMGLHNHRVEPARTYYVLYRNTEGAIKSGRPATIAVGDLSLKHVVSW